MLWVAHNSGLPVAYGVCGTWEAVKTQSVSTAPIKRLAWEWNILGMKHSNLSGD